MGGWSVSELFGTGPDLNTPPVAGKRVLVTGLGRSGMAAADGLLAAGAEVLVVDDNASAQ